MSRSVVKFLVLSVCSALLCLMVACTSGQVNGKASTVPLTTGISPWPGFAGPYIAESKEFFKAEEVSVKEVAFQTGIDANSAFLAGKLDLLWTGVPDMVVMASKDPSVRLLMLSDYSNGADGILGRDITKPEDVKGKNVARESQFIQLLLLRKYLEQGDLTEKDVTLIELSAADAAAAFAARKVDVAVTYEPWMARAAKEGKGKIIFTSKNTNIIPDGLVTREKVIQERRPELLAYMRAIDKAVKLVKEKPEEAAKLVAKKLGISPEEVPAQIAGVRLFDIEGNKNVVFNPQEPMNVVDSISFAAKTAKDLGLTPNLVDAQTLYDDSLVKSL